MQIIADRFVIDARGHARDLATGEPVCLLLSRVGGVTDAVRWMERCAWFARIAHPSLAPLIDYGPLDEGRRFEAWAAQSGWAGAPGAAAAARRRVDQFLRGTGRTGVADAALLIAARHGRACVIPDAGAGLPDGSGGEASAIGDRQVLGVVRDIDRQVQRAADLLTAAEAGRVVALQVWASQDADAAHASRALARAARVAGLVPCSTRLFHSTARTIVRGRTLVLLCLDPPDVGWQCLMDATLDASRPHVVVFVGDRVVRRAHVVATERWSPAALIASVQPARVARRYMRAIGTAARRSGGVRGDFERAILGDSRHASQLPDTGDALDGAARSSRGASGSASAPRPPRAPRAAEQMATYTTGTSPGPAGPTAVSRAWPAPGELLRLRRLVESGRGLVERGRHQPGERVLRQVMHAFARRGEWAPGCEAALLLSGSLMDRGQLGEVVAVLEHARDWAGRARDLGLVLRVALATANLRLEQGHLSDSECVLETALEAALSDGHAVSHALALALVRCLYWQGRFTDAWHRLSLVPDTSEASDGLGARVWTARARIAIGRGRIADAVAAAARAREELGADGDARLRADAWYASALAYHAAGDAAQADVAAAHACDAARTAHHPVQALRARLLRAELARQRGQRGVASVLVARVARLRPTLPHTVGARVELLADLVSAQDPSTVVERRVHLSGLPALRLFAGATVVPSSPPPAADHIVELLRCCQTADDDAVVLTSVCAIIRRHLGATGVAFFAGDRELVSVAGDGARVDLASAARVRTASSLVLPHRGSAGVEAGLPVRYAGAVIGWLVAQWSPTGAWHDADVTVLATTGAAAAAPALAGLVARRARQRASRGSELLGVSPAMVAVRTAIDKAASAPFAVLIEGESGCGKELVARLLHTLSTRKDRPFTTLNCAALPEELVESELFGHTRGAFTGAVGDRRGVFEEAHTGTLFLDEIGELSARAQAKLLRAIQEGEIRRVGENTSRRVDVRLVSATNRDLRAEAAAGRFRQDLLYRLDVIRITLPPLRDRRDDVPVLAEHFWRAATERVGSRAMLSPAAVAALSRYDWPGNIRELQNVLASLAVRSPRRGLVAASALPMPFTERPVMQACRLDSARRTFDRSFIQAALVRAGGHRARAAEELGVSRQGLAKLMARLEIGESVEEAPTA